MRFRFLIASAALLAAGPIAAHERHQGHGHRHAANCGHAQLEHAGHRDHLHNGHLHHLHAGHVEEHVLEVSRQNPAGERRVATRHRHSANDGHPRVKHGNHVDCIHEGRLHHAHGSHTDDHGAVTLIG